jgi:8-oxo-dGTP diphosphatase
MHTSVRGIIKNDDGIILIHRIKKNSDVEIRDYYVVPGGKMELNESEEETVKREVFEELGIYVRVGTRLLEIYNDFDGSIQIFYECEYVNGILGTGTGPEFTNHDEYYGEYIIEIIKYENLEKINLVPEKIKAYLLENRKDD